MTPMRNRRDVWSIATVPYPGAHFAAMPPALIEPCILAGSSPQACESCDAPWRRVVERVQHGESLANPNKIDHLALYGTRRGGDDAHRLGPAIQDSRRTAGWQPSCACPDTTGAARCVVLDPFAGSGTVLAAAAHLGRAYLGVELNPAYGPLIEERLAREGNPGMALRKETPARTH